MIIEIINFFIFIYYITISYKTSLAATVGSHTISASFAGAGNLLPPLWNIPPSYVTTSFTVTIPTGVICKASADSSATVCITTTVSTANNQIDTFTATPSSLTAGSNVTLTAHVVNALANEPVIFRDTTDNISLGSSVTNSSGYATLTYKTPIMLSTGTYNIIAYYPGGSQLPAQKSTSLNVSSAGNCKGDLNKAICISTSFNQDRATISSFTLDCSLTPTSTQPYGPIASGTYAGMCESTVGVTELYFTAKLVDFNNNPISGKTIKIIDATGGGSTVIGTVITDANGIGTNSTAYGISSYSPRIRNIQAEYIDDIGVTESSVPLTSPIESVPND